MPDPSEAQEIIARARERERARPEPPRVDYDALNKMVRRQRSRLTRAINSGDRGRVIVACRDAVREWNEPGAMWPDCWSRWQRALDDCFPVFQAPDLRDLA